MSIHPDLFCPASGVAFRCLRSTWQAAYVQAIRDHYTGSAGPPPGKKLAWAIFEDRKHRGWIGLGEPAFKLSPRRRLGLSDARPLPHTVSCTIFRVTAPGPTRAGALLQLWHPLAAREWAHRYGWEPEHWETMCMDRGHGGAIGACFRRAGYRRLGWTTGRSARRPAGNTHGPRIWEDADPKLVLYRGPLHRRP